MTDNTRFRVGDLVEAAFTSQVWFAETSECEPVDEGDRATVIETYGHVIDVHFWRYPALTAPGFGVEYFRLVERGDGRI